LAEDEKIEAAKAKDRQIRKPANSVVENLPQQKTRDIMGAKMGVSGKQYDKLKAINEKASERTKQLVRSGDLSINQAN